MDIDNILYDLEIIKQINSNNKLGIYITPGSKKLFVDNSKYFSFATRWYNGYNRNNSIEYLEDLLKRIENNSKLLIEGNHIGIANNLKKCLKESIAGFNELKNTYYSDSIIIAKLVLIINNINKIITNLDNIHIENASLSMIENVENNSNYLSENS